MNKIKTAVVGIGGTGSIHSEYYMSNPHSELIAICAKEQDNPQAFAKKHDIEKAYSDYTELAENKEIEAVSICTPTSLHMPMARLMLEHGKHVLVEKPLALNANECEQLIEAASKNKRKLQVGNMWRFHPEVQFVKSVIDSGLIGKIVKAKSYGIHVNWGPGRWFIDKKLAGGGMLMDMGVHAINTMRNLMGDPCAKTVYARVDTVYGDYEVDDFGLIMIEFDNGALGIIETGMWHPHADGVEASTQMFGTKGYARIFPCELKYEIGSTWGKYNPKIVDDSPYPQPVQHLDMIMHKRQINHFLECILSNQEPINSGQIALEDMKIIDAAYQSSQSKKLVHIS